MPNSDFVEDAIAHGFTQQQADWLEENTVSREDVEELLEEGEEE